ncbi:MAG: hypothetical protein JWN14_2930 [Chthonomonadales bacterium]|nr:hypothetical protein [Chthonomonadales bacterium]
MPMQKNANAEQEGRKERSQEKMQKKCKARLLFIDLRFDQGGK